MSGILDISLFKLWGDHYESVPQIFDMKLESSERRRVGDFVFLFNPQAPMNPSEFGNTVFNNFDDSGLIFSTQEEERVLCWIDFDNEEIVKDKPEEESKEVCDEEVTDSFHPLFINPTLWMEGHSYLALFPDDCLPQALSTELLSLSLNIFRLSSSDYFRLGYDSLGANCDINHLHFHLIYLDRVELEVFAVEKAEKVFMLESSLQHKDQEEINMFSIGVRIYEVDWPVKCLLVTPSQEVNEGNVAEANESLANVVGILVNHLIEQNVPHSIMIASGGTHIYVFVRSFQENREFIKTSFLDCSGIPCFASQEHFRRFNSQNMVEFLATQSATEHTYNAVKSYLASMLSSLYF